jgi:hypothetical protein
LSVTTTDEAPCRSRQYWWRRKGGIDLEQYPVSSLDEGLYAANGFEGTVHRPDPIPAGNDAHFATEAEYGKIRQRYELTPVL